MSSLPPNGKIAYINARLLNPSTNLDTKGALLTEGKNILDFGHSLFANGVPADITVIDCQGACLAPGLVDARVHLREPGEEHKESLRTGCEAAVAGGITSLVCQPDTDPVIDDIAAVEFVARRARKIGLAKVYPYAAATKQLEGKELSEIGLLAQAGAVGFTDARQAIGNSQVMKRALSYAATFEALIIQHPEDQKLSEGGVMNEGELASRLGLSGIPPVAEAIMLERDIRLVEITGGRYHATTLSTLESIDIIRKAKGKKLNVTCDTAPPYFTLNEISVTGYRTFAKLFPPLRQEDDRLAIIEGLKDGTIDLIVSDHAPQDQDSKRLPFAQAEFGAVGLETLLAITLGLYHNGYLTLLQIIDKLSYAPARLLNLPAGQLAIGAAADLVIFDPDRAWRIDSSLFNSKSKNTPFNLYPVQGKVLRTVIDGRTVFCA